MIGFFATLQTLLQLLDFGLATTISREVARGSSASDLEKARRLLHTLARFYWAASFFIAATFYLSAPVLASRWLTLEGLSVNSAAEAIMLMGIVLACRWPIGLYSGVLIGADRLAKLSAISIAMVTVAQLGALLIVIFVSPTLKAFFLWQAFASICYVFLVRFVAWQVLGRPSIRRFDIRQLKTVWRFSLGASAVSISGLFLSNIDKVLLSKILSLSDYGRYTLAALAGSSLSIILIPTFNVIYPRLSVLAVERDPTKILVFYRSGSRLLACALFPVAAFGAIFSKELLLWWTRDSGLADSASSMVSLFLLGTALNGVMHFPYALQLALGKTNVPLILNLTLIVIMVPITFILATAYGGVGGAAAWACLNAIYAIFGAYVTDKYVLAGAGIRPMLEDLAVPAILSLSIVVFGGSMILELEYTYFVKIVVGIGLLMAALVLTLGLSAKDIAYMKKLSRFDGRLPR